MHIITAILVVGIISYNNQSVLFTKQSAAHQLSFHLPGMYFATDDALIITVNASIGMREFILNYRWYMTRSCGLFKKPTIPRYRTNKGYIT